MKRMYDETETEANTHINSEDTRCRMKRLIMRKKESKETE